MPQSDRSASGNVPQSDQSASSTTAVRFDHPDQIFQISKIEMKSDKCKESATSSNTQNPTK